MTGNIDDELKRFREAYAADALDTAAILAVRPRARQLINRLSSEDRTALAEILLSWLDELFLDRTNDEFRAGLELRAQVALDVTPSGLADLDPD